MKSKQRVHHEYTLRVSQFSAYGKAKAILEALEPLKKENYYGYHDKVDEVTIWWDTFEDLG